jgi:trimeric autotransporter adhesin
VIVAPHWGGSSSTTAVFQLGGGIALGATSLFVDDGTYAARDVAGTSISKTVGNSTVTTAPGDINSSTVLVSQGVAPVTTFLVQSGLAAVGTTGNTTTTPICECKYLTWGWWGGSVTYASTQTGGVNINPGGIDNIHMATYVAGNQSLSGQVDTTSTVTINNQQQSSATYYGQMIGNVNNNGQSYIAAGTYQNAWSFGAGRGSLAVTFDGASFSGSTSLTPGTSNFSSGNITTSGGSGRTLNLNGSFFNGNNAATTALYQAGRFGVTGSSYTAAGTFAAQRPQ